MSENPINPETGLTTPGKFPRRSLIAVGIAVGVILLVILLWYAISVILLFFAGILLAILLRSMASGLSRLTRLPVVWSLTLAILLIIGFFVLIVWFMAPRIAEQAVELANRLPQAVQHLMDHIAQSPGGKQTLQFFHKLAPTTAPTSSLEILGQAGGILSSAVGMIVTFVIVIFLGIYLAANPQIYVDGIVSLFPLAYRQRACQILHQIGYTLQWWLIGQLIDMATIGVLTAIGLWLIGIPLALVIGVLAAIFNFVPNFGPLVSFIPAILIALTIDPQKALYVTILYIVAQSFEGYVLAPYIQRKAVALPPALTITAQVLLAALVGIVGLALATPLAAATLVAVKMMYVQDVLGDNIELDKPPDSVPIPLPSEPPK